jgi:hypothetical protein
VDRFFLWVYHVQAEYLAEGNPEVAAELQASVQEPPDFAFTYFDFSKEFELFREPTLQVSNLPQKWLPHMTVQELYTQYEEWCRDMEATLASLQSFHRCWHLWSPRVLRFRDQQQHARCAICAKLSEYRRQAHTEVARRQIQRSHLEHHKQQFADRRAAARINGLSEMSCMGVCPVAPLLAFEADGMDEAKFRLPRNTRSSKMWDALWRPQVHCSGVIIHGLSEHYYLADPCIPKDVNCNAEIISRSLDFAVKAFGESGKVFPRHIYLQTDNTSREQKNSSGLCFLAWLVGTGRADSSQLSTLSVGHTHSGIDQRFSVVGAQIACSEVLEDMDDMKEIIQNQVKGAKGRKVHVEKLGSTRDWAGFLGHLGVQLHGHTGPGSAHVFRFVRRRDLLSEGPDGLVVDRGGYSLDVPDDPLDVVMLVKANLRDNYIMQQPLLVLPRCLLDARLPKQPLGPKPRNPLSERQKANHCDS